MCIYYTICIYVICCYKREREREREKERERERGAVYIIMRYFFFLLV